MTFLPFFYFLFLCQSYKDFKYALYGNAKSGVLELVFTAKHRGYIYICQTPGLRKGHINTSKSKLSAKHFIRYCFELKYFGHLRLHFHNFRFQNSLLCKFTVQDMHFMMIFGTIDLYSISMTLQYRIMRKGTLEFGIVRSMKSVYSLIEK